MIEGLEFDDDIDVATIEVAPDEVSLIVRSLKNDAMVQRERGKLLARSIPESHTGMYHPNRELSKAHGDCAEVLIALAQRVEAQI